MLTPLSALGLQRKYKVDFALVPVAVILIEFAIFTAQLPKVPSYGLGELVSLRLFHTILMLFSAYLVSQTFIKLRIIETHYLTFAITGLVFMALGDLLHLYLASAFGIELIESSRRLGIILIEGVIWFPAFLIIAGNRPEILRRFKEYEAQLISATRSRTRTSPEFLDIQLNLHNQIREDLYSLCTKLKDSISEAIQTSAALPQLNDLIAPNLLGHDLRKLSVRLQYQQQSSNPKSLSRRKIDSLSIFYQQFRILYSSAIRQSPLPQSTYIAILIGLVAPLYFYFYSLTEVLVEFPILLISILILTTFITRMQRKGSSRLLRFSSILIFLTGMIPLLLDLFGEPFGNKVGNHFPLIISLFVLPLTYYISMELFQVLRPTALALLQNEKLEASAVLQRRVSRIVREEFSSNLAHQWAVFIHGKILTRLAATSLKVESSSASGDTQAFYGSINSLLELLARPDEGFESKMTNLQDEINSRLNPWKGLLEINLFIDPELINVESSRIRDLGEVIEELLSNAIRHGKAQKIVMRIERAAGGDVQIISIDDSVVPPPQTQGRSGLGTRIFNLASDGRWTIERIGDATEFRLTMAISL